MSDRTAGPAGERRVRMALLATLALASACSSQLAQAPDEWWPGTVVGVMRLSEVPAEAEQRCLQLEEAERPQERTAVLVRRRIGRSPHTMAFLIPRGAVLTVGERVRVDTDTCRIAPAPVTGAQGAA